MKPDILLIGAGSWGTALALVLARNGHKTSLWDIMPEHIDQLIADRCNNKHLAGADFPASLMPIHHYAPLADSITHIIIASPCAALRSVLASIQPYAERALKLCLACKGLEHGSVSLNHTLVAEYLPDMPLAILSGPSFAREVADGLPTAVTIAAARHETAVEFAELFHNEVFRIYTHDDIVGVQLGGAVKNVMAIAAGIADGLHFGANTRAALVSRGLAEIMRLGIAMGGKTETFMGLAGLGDLVLTCTDDQSRNRRFGLALAEGKTPAQAGAEIGQAIEGLRTAKAVCDLAAKYGIDMPISQVVLKVINAELTPKEAVAALLSRDRKEETA